MKNSILIALLIVIGTTAYAQKGKNPAKLEKQALKPVPELKTSKDSLSYAYGILLGNSLKRQLTDEFNTAMLLQGINSVVNGDSVVLSVDAAQGVYQSFATKKQAAQAEQNRKDGEATKMAGEKFLAENKNRPGVTTTATGLQYEVIKKGDGTVSPKATDDVTVHYHGTVIDGTVFDSSVERGEPITFNLGQVIPGWTEGVQLMHVGDKFRFFIPSNLAYGEQSPTPVIKPNSVLIFEVELLDVKQN